MRPGEIDPDVLSVLGTIAGSGERNRVGRVRARHEQKMMDKFETQLELLGDELEAVIPRSNPLFVPVLMGAVLRKLMRKLNEQEQPEEYKSELDHFPPGW